MATIEMTEAFSSIRVGHFRPPRLGIRCFNTAWLFPLPLLLQLGLERRDLCSQSCIQIGYLLSSFRAFSNFARSEAREDGEGGGVLSNSPSFAIRASSTASCAALRAEAPPPPPFGASAALGDAGRSAALSFTPLDFSLA